MKIRSVVLILFIFCLSSVAYGQQAKLEGYVLDDKENRVSTVIITTPGSHAETDSRGRFVIGFPDSVKPGQATRIEVVKPNWVIFEPMLGNCVTQSSARNYEPLKVIIVRKGSPLALAPKRLGQVIARWADERSKLRSQVDQLRSQLDEYSFLREYSEKYGFTLDQFVNAGQQWALSKDATDKEEQALKEYFLKNYELAAQLAHASALVADAELERDNKKKIEDSLKVIRRFKLEGNAFYEQNKFREALAAYNEIDKRFSTKKLSKEDLMGEWAGVKFLIGNAKGELGDIVEGEEGSRLLKEALSNYQQTASFYTRETFPQQWAAVRNNMATVLFNLGLRVSGPESITYLKEGLTAFRAALEIRSRAEFPQEWATTQRNLALTLETLGQREGGTEGIRYLKDAVAVHRAALEVRTRESSPRRWAAAQNHLGALLARLGELVGRAEDIKYMNEAVAAYRAALEVYTRAQSPREWATMQNNLGTVLSDLGLRASGPDRIKYLNDAVAAYRGALEVISRERSPWQWASTQRNLAESFFRLRDWSGAEQAYKEVLALEPDDAEAYSSAGTICHDVLFKFEEAFGLNQQWVVRHPDDISAQADFAEKHFTTGRFAECGQRISTLLTKPDVSVRTKTALRAIEIADLLALGQTNQVPARLEALIAEVSHQTAEFKVTGSFEGTRHFIGQNEKLSVYRTWLEQMFEALTRKDRNSMLEGLRQAGTSFKEH